MKVIDIDARFKNYWKYGNKIINDVYKYLESNGFDVVVSSDSNTYSESIIRHYKDKGLFGLKVREAPILEVYMDRNNNQQSINVKISPSSKIGIKGEPILELIKPYKNYINEVVIWSWD